MKKSRKKPPLQVGSMADIAFLLLIFFLVTATVQTEAGLNITLPRYEEDPKPTNWNEKNVLSIELNALDELQVEQEAMSTKLLTQKVEDFVFNEVTNPKKAIVSITTNSGSTYKQYIGVLDAVKAGYQAVWNRVAIQKYNMRYQDLPSKQQQEVFDTFPLVVAETESKSIVENNYQ